MQATEPDADNDALRVLRLYQTVLSRDAKPTPIRMNPIAIVLEAPPDDFAWGRSVFSCGNATAAVPLRLPDDASQRQAYIFRSDASAWIWRAAKRFRREQ